MSHPCYSVYYTGVEVRPRFGAKITGIQISDFSFAYDISLITDRFYLNNIDPNFVRKKS